MTERTEAILEAALRDFIKTGRPITSESLFHTYDFGIKPAMIRWELNELSKAGYFFQRHPSGGRIPSDKAYRFFTERALREDEVRERDTRGFEDAFSDFIKGARRTFVEDLAERFGNLSVGYEPERGEVYESGLHELLSRLQDDAITTNEMIQIVNDFESIPSRVHELRSWWEEERSWPRVFIGKNPFTRSAHVAVVASCLKCDDGGFLLLSIGPKRMDYTKPIRAFRFFERSLE